METSFSDRGSSFSNLGATYAGATVTEINSLSTGRIIAAMMYDADVGTACKLTHSDNNGTDWAISLSPLFSEPTFPYQASIVDSAELSSGVVMLLSPSSSNYLAYRGDNFTTISGLDTVAADFSPWAIVSAGTNRAIMGGAGDVSGSISISTDNGLTWGLASGITDDDTIYDMVNLGGGIILACTGSTNGYILRSTDYGDTWTNIGQPGSSGTLYRFSNAGAGVVYCLNMDTFEIVKSTDYGASWTVKSTISTDASYLGSILSLGESVVLVGAGYSGHIYRSINGGESWTDLGQLFGQDDYPSMVSLVDDQLVFIGTSPSGYILKSSWLLTSVQNTFTGRGEYVGETTTAYSENYRRMIRNQYIQPIKKVPKMPTNNLIYIKELYKQIYART